MGPAATTNNPLPSEPSARARYGFAVLAGCLSNGLGALLCHHWRLRLPFTAFYMPIITASAWYGGLGPGLVCTALCAAATAWFWTEPTTNFRISDPDDVVAVVLFVAIGVVISVLCEQLHRARRRERIAREMAERAAEQARVACLARDDVLAVVAHDLKSPLNAIDLSAAMIERGAPADSAVRRRAASIRQVVARMSRLIRDLLDIASLESGALSIEAAPEDVAPLIAEAVELHAASAAERGVQLEAQLPAEPLRILCDRARVLQVLSNLIGNALKFTEHGGSVTVRVERVDGQVRFSVHDTGKGIPEEKVARIFERYWHGERSSGGGTGLGLYIARAIVEAHRGAIWVQSAAGRGSTFFFTLPLVISSLLGGGME